MAEFWPTADADPAATPKVVEYAGIWREMPKYVYSRTLCDAGWHSTIVRELVPDDIRALKHQPGGDLALGGAELAAAFLQEGLVDEWRLYVHPLVIGRGQPLFPAGAPADMRLLETRPFANGVVLLRYEAAA
jgi:dihydrofolate reductase